MQCISTPKGFLASNCIVRRLEDYVNITWMRPTEYNRPGGTTMGLLIWFRKGHYRGEDDFL
jgi:hypothetical protein